MKLSSAAASIVVLTVTTVLAQPVSPAAPIAAPTATPRRMPTRRWVTPTPNGSNPGVQNPMNIHQRLQDMETTLTGMHSVLKQMRAKAAASKTKDPLVKANLDMWELMVSHLDKQLQELRIADAARQDLEARRAAMYKQADAKAEAAAHAARAASANEATAASSGAQSAAPSSAAPSATPVPNNSTRNSQVSNTPPEPK